MLQILKLLVAIFGALATTWMLFSAAQGVAVGDWLVVVVNTVSAVLVFRFAWFVVSLPNRSTS